MPYCSGCGDWTDEVHFPDEVFIERHEVYHSQDCYRDATEPAHLRERFDRILEEADDYSMDNSFNQLWRLFRREVWECFFR